ncbi:endoglucanase [Psychrosphaera saromensis]|uniref:cellulase n=1 Tax=Psychrosphaera saromensis TaxID=716813 RepID=A0A2S7UWW1_9GAMM|nr:cellulose synthase complex periplasmic endoglucanase BcsZ [Psychrosphaera saromensis]PQJ53761.1 endo-1,4-D-glucanase [Psychrosphaera saromensis]GHB62496.1 endoglucanase [Psychrosphaera saromensis]GLQ15450.1 endoglucanase [Psychrosphaera saromensis]
MKLTGLFFSTLSWLALSILLVTSTAVKSVETEADWPLWQFFQDQFITESGRVVDPYDGDDITTSEGQSYAMFFALVNNQPELFERLLQWTEQNLAQGDLANNLPAWKWGENAFGIGNIFDKNSASDSDLWILYTLLEASRLWNKPEYGRLAEQLANTILQGEVALVPELGYFLLPASTGFINKNTSITLNPSYVPMQLMDYFYTHLSDDRWRSLQQTSLLLTMESSLRGFSPDWVDYNIDKKQFENATVGSYNAIRVYLWAGMLSPDSDHWPILKLHFAKSVQFVNKLKAVPESINTSMLAYNNLGNIGFDISFLPLITRLQYTELEQVMLTKIENSDLLTSDSYYQSVLALYGLGWTEKRFEFSANGQLIVSWKNEK